MSDWNVQELVQQAIAHLQNATELAQRPCAKEELLYMWDNQITALDAFLANTEEVADKALQTWRTKLQGVKKQLTDAVVAFEAQAAGEEVPDDDIPDEEWIGTYLEMAGEMTGLVAEALEEPVQDVKDLIKWENPLDVVNSYLADSEPYQSASQELHQVRLIVRAAKSDLEGRIRDVFDDWRSKDLAAK
ncbi:MAG: hypothetical protein ACPGQL_08190 [Thermoplasmatota archaeon]